ncbi:hypothetical protein Pan44_55600 [Caulifigura coniformis]|uniref:Uncharacterized protein n=1 Tax=Caulifigura coniformis TaxID=2527983 RepID=A0A517SMZ6_9PLAN|nr:Flp family type IVb pilin [Caulifigura coniformis]QDT57491.1 hypothetical protein Pan44_55600 [Caulifigura coniformis]
MSAIWRSLLRDERGFVITAELVLISTVLVLGLVAALSAVKAAVAGELGDVANAIGSLNQSYYTHGFHGCGSRIYGSSFLDNEDSSEEQKADFATAIKTSCTSTAITTLPCGVTPCVPPAPCAQLPAPCETPCQTGCGTGCGGGCGTGCGSVSGCGSGCGTGCGSGCRTSVPPVICPPGPRPFTGTDPFAPGAVSPQNMLLQGISYGGVCAPPISGIQPVAIERSCADPVQHPCPAQEVVAPSLPPAPPGYGVPSAPTGEWPAFPPAHHGVVY